MRNVWLRAYGTHEVTFSKRRKVFPFFFFSFRREHSGRGYTPKHPSVIERLCNRLYRSAFLLQGENSWHIQLKRRICLSGSLCQSFQSAACWQKRQKHHDHRRAPQSKAAYFLHLRSRAEPKSNERLQPPTMHPSDHILQRRPTANIFNTLNYKYQWIGLHPHDAIRSLGMS